jgi:hypothetical protein
MFASELVDWLHFVETPLHPTELDRLISVMERLHKPTLQLLLENIDLVQGLDSFVLGRPEETNRHVQVRFSFEARGIIFSKFETHQL